jgi:glutamate synthase (NADPH/NADH) large chain
VDDRLDRKELLDLIRQHYLYTGSSLARTLLDDWIHSVDDFIKVIPFEYKHILEQERLRSLAEKVQHLQIQY